jgi:phospholipid/cholesterol/gamma-HCH transport system permease protein
VNGEAILNGRADGDRLTLSGAGDWTATQALRLEHLVAAQSDHAQARRVTIDMAAVKRLDTYGAWLLERLVRDFKSRGAATEVVGLSETYRPLMDEVRGIDLAKWDAHDESNPISNALGSIGATIYTVFHSVHAVLNMFGAVMVAFGRVLTHPRRFRFTSMVHHLDNAGWCAVPIILLITFLIGGIIAQQGAFQLRFFGAEIFTVDLVGILSLREIATLLTAVMVAGRSGSAMTAELGSMRMREEIDALRVMGLDPVNVLVLPRVLALVLVLPLLTFIAGMATLAGAMLTVWLYIDVPPQVFLARLHDAIDLSTLLSGLIKAPFMALIIGLIACAEGMAVEGSAESLGRHTTAAVVKSIFMVIVVDGIFAIFYAAIDY